jgi:hypothetical protein
MKRSTVKKRHLITGLLRRSRSGPAQPFDRADVPARPAPQASTVPVADPSLELFGHGWTPRKGPSSSTGSSPGRHRAPEA